MTTSLTLALAQLNFHVGDIRGNAQRIIAAVREAAAQGAELVMFPEMAITGYPAEDLLFKQVFQQAAMEAVAAIATALADCPAAALVGGYWVEGTIRYNATFLIDGGKVVHRRYKSRLPNYGVFDEKRLFTKGEPPMPVDWRGHRLALLICEEIWQPDCLSALVGQVDYALVQNASPYEVGKVEQRKAVAVAAAEQLGAPVIYLNLIGGQDELVFDGGSFAVNTKGEDVARLPAFAESLSLLRFDGSHCANEPMHPVQDDLATIYQAMVLGLRDYVEKNGFKGVVLGLSGGIDSGLSAAVAVDALGAERVRGLMMPSPYTSAESIEDAEIIARNLGIVTHTIPITEAMQCFDAMLKPVFGDAPADTTEENIQARIRGQLLMAVSNKQGLMVLTTGNKSEMSVGYATLYGDMCGGYSVLKDVYKTTVFALSHWRNALAEPLICRGALGAVIPERMISKPPSAELKPDQKDEDSLPPYPVLDAILRGLIEGRQSVKQVAAAGYDMALVEKVARMIYLAEYKRRQSPPGVKITGMSFGRDRRYPITNRWIWQR